MRTLTDIIEEVKEAIKGHEGFSIDSIFPFYNHSTRIDLNQIELVDEYCGTNLYTYIKEHGWNIDTNTSLWSL